jgi:hypothetical protein
LFVVGASTDPPVQSIPLHSSLPTNNYSIIISSGDFRRPSYPIKIDSSGQLFVPCKNSSSYYMLVFTSQGTILGRIYDSFFSYKQLGIEATKYQFSLAQSNSENTSMYDF